MLRDWWRRILASIRPTPRPSASVQNAGVWIDSEAPIPPPEMTLRLVELDRISTSAANAVERARRGAEQLTLSELSPVLTTIDLDQTIAAEDVKVTLVQMVVHGYGGRFLFTVEAASEPSRLDGPLVRIPECTVIDSMGTNYRAWTPFSPTSANAIAVGFSPRPRDDAREITVTLNRLADWAPNDLMSSSGKPAKLRDGPWVFRVLIS